MAHTLFEFYPRAQVTADDFTGETFTGITINGGTINGGTINGVEIFVAGDTIELGADGITIDSQAGLSYDPESTLAVKWKNLDDEIVSSIGGRTSTTGTAPSLELRARPPVGGTGSRINLNADASNPSTGGVFMQLDGGGATLLTIGASTVTFQAAAVSANSFSGSLFAPRSSGTERFAVDATAGGASITLADFATATPFGGTNNFGGAILIQETAVDGAIGFFITGGGGIVKVADPLALFSTTAGNAATVNVYLSSNVVTIENRRGGSRTFNVVAIRTRAVN